MSGLDPNKVAIVKELQTRRATLSPDKVALLDELSSRLGIQSSAPAPNLDDRSPVTVAQDQWAGVVTGAGLDKPLLGAYDAVSELPDILARQFPKGTKGYQYAESHGATPERLRRIAEERANRTKNISMPSSVMNRASQRPVESLKNVGAMAAMPVTVPAMGIAGGARALGTSVHGAASLLAPSIPPPSRESFERAAEGAGAFATVAPVIPPVVKGVKSIPSAVRSMSELKPYQRDAALGNLAATGIKSKGTSPYKIGADSRQGVRQAFQELGLDPERLPTKNTSPLVNELVIGGTQDDLARLNAVLEAEHNALIASGKRPPTPFVPEESIQLAVADRAVEIYHRPIQNAVDTFAQVKRPEVKRAVYHDLMKKAAEESAGNPELAKALKNAAKQVAGTPDTVEAMNALKVKANKMPSPRYSGTPSQQIASDVLTSTAQAELGDSIRRHLYPAIENIGKLNGQPMTGQLVLAGKRESSAIALRDGIYDQWSKAAIGQSTADLEKWWKYVLRGHSEAIPATSTASRQAANAIVRAVRGVDMPMADFNTKLRQGTGSLRGFIPERAIVTPRREIAALSEVPEPTLPPFRRVTWGEIPPPELSRMGGVELNPSRMIEAPRGIQMPAYSGGRADVGGPAPGAAYPGTPVNSARPVTRGPAKGMSLHHIEYDPVTNKPKFYVYEGPDGKRKTLRSPQS